MKNLAWFTAALCWGAFYFMVKTRPASPTVAAPVEELAHKLQDAWADHHTVV